MNMDRETIAKLRQMVADYHQAVRQDYRTPVGISVRLFIADDIISQVGDEIVAALEAQLPPSSESEVNEHGTHGNAE
jgi:hypothetical protein